MTNLRIPDSLEDITSQWLTGALRSTKTITTAKVSAFAIQDGENFNGHTGPVVRLKISYDSDSSGPESLLLKLSHSDVAIRNSLRVAYQREYLFYSQASGSAAIGKPECYYSDLDLESSKCIFLLEDLAPAKVGDQVAGCSLQEARLALQNLAGLHASFWESDILEEIGILALSDVSEEFRGIYLERWAIFKSKYMDRIPHNIIEMGDLFGHRFIEIWNQLGSPPRTLGHGDFRLDNLMFGTRRGEKTFAAVDWQLAFIGRGSCDLAWFLATCIEPSMRKEWDKELIELYHSTLTGMGVEGYEFDELLSDFRLSLFHSFNLTVRAFALFDLTSARDRAFVSVMLERLFACIEDYQVADLVLQ